MNRYSLFLVFLWGATLFSPCPVAAAEDSTEVVAGRIKGAIDIQQDLALMPSGELVSLKTGQVLDQTRLFTKFEGNSSAGCGVLRNGSAACWETHDSRPPVFFLPENLGQVSSVAGVPDDGCAARKDGKVTCWDRYKKPPSQGPVQISEPVLDWSVLEEQMQERPKPPLHYTELFALNNVAAVTGGRDGCALLRNGTVACWGLHFSNRSESHLAYDVNPKRVPGLSHVRQVMQAGHVRCALRDSGEVLCWGRRFVDGISTAAWHQEPFDEKPRRIQGVADATQFSISIGSESGCATRKNGQVACWGKLSCGKGNSGKAAIVPGLVDVAAISVGYPSNCALYRRGGIYCWGGCSRAGTPPPLSFPRQ